LEETPEKINSEKNTSPLEKKEEMLLLKMLLVILQGKR
jgi:hypothetical protein